MSQAVLDKTNALLKLIKHQRPDIDEIYSYIKNPFESNYQLLINKREKVEIKKLKNPEAFIEYSQTINDAYENLEEYNLTKKKKVLMVFDGLMVDMKANNKKCPVVIELR